MNPKNKMTINEIARLAQVSKGTVSKVLNHKPGIGEETRKRVMELVDHLGYHPSSVAQALANSRTGNIGLIIPHEAGQSLNGAYWSTLIKEITQRAAKDDYHLMLFTPQEENALEKMYEDILNSPRVDGFIIGAEQIDRKSMSRFVMEDIPFVLIGKNSNFSHYHVDVDSVSATEMAMDYLFSKGYRKIGMMSGPLSYPYNEERLKTYQTYMQKKNLTPCAGISSEYDIPETREALDNLLKQLPDPDALFIGAGGGFMFDTLEYLKEKKMNPEKMGILTYDDYRFLDFMEPKLTAINQPLDQVGVKATEMLLMQILEKKEPCENIILKASLAIRSSCGEKK